jgi:hypothetical protein
MKNKTNFKGFERNSKITGEYRRTTQNDIEAMRHIAEWQASGNHLSKLDLPGFKDVAPMDILTPEQIREMYQENYLIVNRRTEKLSPDVLDRMDRGSVFKAVTTTFERDTDLGSGIKTSPAHKMLNQSIWGGRYRINNIFYPWGSSFVPADLNAARLTMMKERLTSKTCARYA